MSNLGDATDGVGLVLQWHALLIDIDAPASSLSLDFGLDDPDYWGPGAVARLRVFPAGAELWPFVPGNVLDSPIADVSVALNRDGLMNQSITVSGSPFQRMLFPFVGAAQMEPGFTVDNVRFETVPEPGTLGLGALAALVFCGVRGLRKGSHRRSV